MEVDIDPLVASTVDDILKEIFPWEFFGRHFSIPSISVQVNQKRRGRLNLVQELLCKLVKNYRKCNILALLDCYCPVEKQKIKTLESKSDMVGFQTPIEQVIGFTRAVFRHVVPVEMFGDLNNFNSFLKNLDKLLKIRKFETLNLEMFVDCVKVDFKINLLDQKHSMVKKFELSSSPSHRSYEKKAPFQ